MVPKRVICRAAPPRSMDIQLFFVGSAADKGDPALGNAAFPGKVGDDFIDKLGHHATAVIGSAPIAFAQQHLAGAGIN